MENKTFSSISEEKYISILRRKESLMRKTLVGLVFCSLALFFFASCKEKENLGSGNKKSTISENVGSLLGELSSDSKRAKGYLKTSFGLQEVSYKELPKEDQGKIKDLPEGVSLDQVPQQLFVEVEGDMMVPRTHIFEEKPSEFALSGVAADDSLLWPEGKIPYCISQWVYGGSDPETHKLSDDEYQAFKEKVEAEMQTWSETVGGGLIEFVDKCDTKINFAGYEFTPADFKDNGYSDYYLALGLYYNQNMYAKPFTNLVLIQSEPDLGGGLSSVGRVANLQYIRYGYGCESACVAHELGHTLGLWHEHAHPDRDEFLKVYEDRVDPDMWYNFQTKTAEEAPNITPFDTDSVMLYPSYAFGKDDLPNKCAGGDLNSCSLTTIDGKYIDYPDGISVGDASIMTKLYGCGEGQDCNENGLQDDCSDLTLHFYEGSLVVCPPGFHLNDSKCELICNGKCREGWADRDDSEETDCSWDSRNRCNPRFYSLPDGKAWPHKKWDGELTGPLPKSTQGATVLENNKKWKTDPLLITNNLFKNSCDKFSIPFSKVKSVKNCDKLSGCAANLTRVLLDYTSAYKVCPAGMRLNSSHICEAEYSPVTGTDASGQKVMCPPGFTLKNDTCSMKCSDGSCRSGWAETDSDKDTDCAWDFSNRCNPKNYEVPCLGVWPMRRKNENYMGSKDYSEGGSTFVSDEGTWSTNPLVIGEDYVCE